jgi:hypothetical protein
MFLSIQLYLTASVSFCYAALIRIVFLVQRLTDISSIDEYINIRLRPPPLLLLLWSTKLHFMDCPEYLQCSNTTLQTGLINLIRAKIVPQKFGSSLERYMVIAGRVSDVFLFNFWRNRLAFTSMIDVIRNQLTVKPVRPHERPVLYVVHDV